mgnify:CR=1 FL=1
MPTTPGIDLAYYLTLFKIEGHSTWRSHLASARGKFERERSSWTHPPKITDKKVYRIDRVTGEIEIV